jgi:hypothetical protein
LLLALSSKNGKDNNDKNNPTDEQELTGSLQISMGLPDLG